MDHSRFQTDSSMTEQLRNEIVLKLGERLGLYRIANFITHRSFLVVHLNTGHVGLAMNYNFTKASETGTKELVESLRTSIEADPLLLETLWNSSLILNPLLRGSLQVAVLSALSKPLLVTPTVTGLKRTEGGISLGSVVRKGDSVCCIGFGGYFLAALKSPNVRRVYLADFYVSQPQKEAEIDALRKAHPDKDLIVSAGTDNEHILAQSDVACITASSLPNGTLLPMLDATRNCRSVILQGHSGHVFPQPLFKRGIHHITTSKLPANAWKSIEAWDNSNMEGANFSSFLDATFTEKISYSA